MVLKDIFISHAWGFDELNRDNHKRCLEIYNKLTENKFHVWFDDMDMKTNIDLSIINGIDNAKIILVCLTKKYCDKINFSVYNNMPQDNCYKEWNYSIFRQKYIIPIIMEEQMKDIYIKEKGIIQMYLNNMLYIDATSNIDNAVQQIIQQLKVYNLYASLTPNNSNNSLFDYFNQLSPSKKSSRSNSPSEPIYIDPNELSDSSNSSNSNRSNSNRSNSNTSNSNNSRKILKPRGNILTKIMFVTKIFNCINQNKNTKTRIIIREKTKKNLLKNKSENKSQNRENRIVNSRKDNHIIRHHSQIIQI